MKVPKIERKLGVIGSVVDLEGHLGHFPHSWGSEHSGQDSQTGQDSHLAQGVGGGSIYS